MAELVDAQDLKSCEIQPSCRFKSGLRHHFKNYSLLFIVDEFFYKIYYYFISNNYWHSLNCCVIINLSSEKTFGGIPKSGWRDRSWKPGGRANGAGVRIPFPPPLKFIYWYRGMEQLVARWAHNPEVGGSSPPPATIMVPWCSWLTRLPVTQKIAGSSPVGTAIIWFHSSVGRAKDWKSLCRWFDSTWNHH